MSTETFDNRKKENEKTSFNYSSNKANLFVSKKIFSKKTPSTNNSLNLSYFTRVNTSPAKVKLSHLNDSKEQLNSKGLTIGKNVTRSQCIFPREEEKDSIFYEESKLGYCPQIYKPSLNSTESHHKIIEYSKSKKFKEDQVKFADVLQQTISIGNEKENLISSEEKEITEQELTTEQLAQMSKNSRLIYYESRLPVPIEKKDDEKFKLLKMKEMKRESLPNCKSAQIYDYSGTPRNQKEFRGELEYHFLKKKKILHSAKKRYSSSIVLCDPLVASHIQHYPLYRDYEIGIGEYWQAHITESNKDEDIPTDDEQLMLAHSYCLAEFYEAMQLFSSNGIDCLRNKKLIYTDEE